MNHYGLGQSDTTIQCSGISAYRVPTESPEQDGTLDWDSTTIVLLELRAGRTIGFGFGYADVATAQVLETMLLPVFENQNALEINRLHVAMANQVRNLGRPGIASMAISVADVIQGTRPISEDTD